MTGHMKNQLGDKSVRGDKQQHHSLSKTDLLSWPALALALVVGVAAALNNSQFLVARTCESSLSLGAAVEHVPVTCSSKQPGNTSAAAAAAAWTTPCYSLNDSAPALLEPAVLELLRERQQDSQTIDDWLQLGNSSRSILQCTSFIVPRVIHQTWVGNAPQPTKWINTFREDYVTKCPGWTYKLWTDENLSELQHLDRDFFDNEPSPNGKSDILRTAILDEHGGVYIDADSQWVNDKCLDEILLLASDTGFFAVNEPGMPYAASGVFGAVRHHPVTRLYQQTQVILSTGGRTGAPWQRLGPLAISAAMGVADNHAPSRHCVGTDSTSSTGRLVLQQSYFEEDLPASTSLLMTSVDSRYFYPVYWHDVDMDKLTNLTYASEMCKEAYPEAATFQLGFTTNKYKPTGE